MFSAKQEKKYISGKRVIYEFLVFQDGEKIKTKEMQVPKLDKDGKMIPDVDTNTWVTETVVDYAKIHLAVEAGTTESQLKAAVKRQLLEFRIEHERDHAKIEHAPDLQEVTLDE